MILSLKYNFQECTNCVRESYHTPLSRDEARTAFTSLRGFRVCTGNRSSIINSSAYISHVSLCTPSIRRSCVLAAVTVADAISRLGRVHHAISNNDFFILHGSNYIMLWGIAFSSKLCLCALEIYCFRAADTI